jgi:hypothetical protein
LDQGYHVRAGVGNFGPRATMDSGFGKLMGKMRSADKGKGKGASKGKTSKGCDRDEMAALLKLAVGRMVQHDIDLRAVQMRLIISVGIYDEAMKQAMLDITTEWNATSSCVRRPVTDTPNLSSLPSGHLCGYSLYSCLFYMICNMLKEEAIRQNALAVVPALQELAEREDHDLLLFRVKHYSGHPKPMRQRCWRFNITPSLQCPTEVIYALINLISVLDAGDAKIRVLPSALSTYRFLDDLQQDWRMKTGKAVMPHLELSNDVNAWDAMMQEAARDYDPFRPLPIVPDARADHAKRVGALPEGCGKSLKNTKRKKDDDEFDNEGFDLRRWANEYVTDM